MGYHSLGGGGGGGLFFLHFMFNVPGSMFVYLGAQTFRIMPFCYHAPELKFNSPHMFVMRF